MLFICIYTFSGARCRAHIVVVPIAVCTDCIKETYFNPGHYGKQLHNDFKF